MKGKKNAPWREVVLRTQQLLFGGGGGSFRGKTNEQKNRGHFVARGWVACNIRGRQSIDKKEDGVGEKFGPEKSSPGHKKRKKTIVTLAYVNFGSNVFGGEKKSPRRG